MKARNSPTRRGKGLLLVTEVIRLIRGAGPICSGLPQRGLGETGKSPITTVKSNRVNCGLLSCDHFHSSIALLLYHLIACFVRVAIVVLYISLLLLVDYLC